MSDRTFKMKSPDIVATDINAIRKNARRVIPLNLLSAQLTTKIDWLHKFYLLMKDNVYPFRGNINLFELTKEKAVLLKCSGITEFVVGMEALTDNTLRLLNKKHSFADIVRGIKILEEIGLPYRLHIRCGYGETRADVREAIKNLRAIRKLITKGKVDLAPIGYIKGTDIHMNPPGNLVMRRRKLNYAEVSATAPFAEWAKFAAIATKMGLLGSRRSLRSFWPEWDAIYRAGMRNGKQK